MSMPPEEKLDHLKAFIRRQTQADTVEVLQFQPLSGGAIQENSGLAVRLTGGTLPGEHRFVVRSDAPSSLSASLSRSQEFAILQTAWKAGVRVPRPWWLCTDRSLLGGEFYVMQWAGGSASGRRLAGDDLLTPQARQALLFDLGCELGRLHQVSYSAQQLPFLQAPAEDAATRRIRDYRQALSTMPDAFPALELGLQVLECHNPGPGGHQVLCHGDFRTGNYLVDDQGRLTAILDWEFASWSDPHEDLGWMCARSWRFGHPEREAGGVGDKADFFAGYESVTGHPVDPLRVAYWEVMASVRWAVIALGQRQRHLSQQESSLELALTGRMLPEIQQDMMTHLRDFLSQAGEPAAAYVPAPLPDTASGPVGTGDLPGGADLLKTARETLLQQILPSLAPEQHYAARMIANAMGMAGRELESGAEVAQYRAERLRAFYGTPAHEPAPALSRLADDIRQGRLTARADLFNLIDALLDQALLLSNPRRLPR